jgi:hypothetical protein
MTCFQMTRRFLTPRVFEGPNLWERAIKGYRDNLTDDRKQSGNMIGQLCVWAYRRYPVKPNIRTDRADVFISNPIKIRKYIKIRGKAVIAQLPEI